MRIASPIKGGTQRDLSDSWLGLGRVVKTGFNPSGVWGRLRGDETVVAGILVFCRWQWTVGDDPVLYANRATGARCRGRSTCCSAASCGRVRVHCRVPAVADGPAVSEEAEDGTDVAAMRAGRSA